MSDNKNKKIKVTPMGVTGMLKFKNLGEDRLKVIGKAPEADIVSDYAINAMAKRNHPDYQEMVIENIKEYPGANAKTFVLKRADGEPAAMFRAGQYVTVVHEIDGYEYVRPYTLMSSPEEAKYGKYEITIKGYPDGFTSLWAVSQYKIGDKLKVSGPMGHFYHEPLRDGENVVAAIGGSSITVALAMARAIRDGNEDFNLTILYGCATKRDIICFDALSDVVAECDRVKLVHVLANEKRPDYEYGLINSYLINKYAPQDYSLIVCGNAGFMEHMRKESSKLFIPSRKIRFELTPVPAEVWKCKDYPIDCKGRRYKLVVRQGGKEFRITASANEPLMVALEKARIKAPVACRSGECGFCRSKLLEGAVYMPEANDFRRASDVETGYIHPCAAYPCSDVVIDVPCSYM